MTATAAVRAALLAVPLLLAAPPSLSAQEAPVPAAAKEEGKPADVEALRKELEATYLQVRQDFHALRGEKAPEHIAKLAEALRAAAEGSQGGFLPDSEIPAVWTKAGLLGPVTAERLARRYTEEAAAGGGDAPAVLARAARLVFPEEKMEDNWDKHFLDLDVVARWAKASGGAAAGGAPGAAAASGAPDPADMVLVPKGEFHVPENRGRGWPDPGQKAEKRTVKAFYMDRTEVSCAAYGAFLGTVKDAKLKERILPSEWSLGEKGAVVMPAGAGNLPVTGIPYEGAAAFAQHHGKRLPTEDEWERAARGNLGWLYPWGNEWVAGAAVVGGAPGPAPVGTTGGDKSTFGVLDLCGNVSEICATFPDGKTIKGIPKATDQVVRRGGNFKEAADEAANDWRFLTGPVSRSDLIGFRCAMDERDYERKYGKK